MPIRPFSLPPNPSLVAVILIIRTRSGPRLVFHYPGVPEAVTRSTSWHFGSAGSDSDDAGGTSSDDEQTVVSDDDASTTSSRHLPRPGGLPQGRHGGRDVGSLSSSRRTARTLQSDAPDNDEDDDDDNSNNNSSSNNNNNNTNNNNNSNDMDNLDVDVLDLNASEKPVPATPANNTARDRSANTIRHENSSTDKHDVCEWEKLLGYPVEGLEMMLSPPSSMHKKRFEVMLDDLVFLGYPVFVRDDGTWRRKKKKKSKTTSTTYDGNGRDQGEANDSGSDNGIDDDDEEEEDEDEDNAGGDGDLFSPPVSPLTTRAPRNANKPDLSQSYPKATVSEAASENGSSNSNQDEMTMFHVVFVMNPPALEYHIRLQEMYDNVVKKFAKALRFEQARSNAVWQDVKKMQSLKAQAKENKTPMSVLWPSLISSCLLAKSIAILYTSIASNKIAHISIGPDFDASIQIPQAISTPYVPTPTEPQLPGLWLTTATNLSDDGQSLSPHAALLLLEDKELMLKEIEGDGKETASPLAFFIRELRPTKSLTKLSTALSLPLSDVQFLARHLIYWRRARAIPPLHIRDTYIVSPNCDMQRLKKAMPLYAQRFSTLPSLPKMLQNLSGKPIQYGFLIPSKDHKAAYMDILAWLLRGGWVTQLCTFAWVKVSAEVKAAAAQTLRRKHEQRLAAKRFPSAMTSKASVGSSDTRHDEHDHDGNVSEAALTATRSFSVDLLSPTLSRPTSDAGSVGSGRTAIPPALTHRADTSPNLYSASTIHARISSPPPRTNTSTPSYSDSEAHETENETETETETMLSMSHLPSTDPSTYEASLILSPHKASSEEVRWLEHLGVKLKEQDQELGECWTMLCGHFDGTRALEEVAAREGMKRRKVQGLLQRLEEKGVLCLVRHW
jgi:hypothetical protein